MGSRALIYIVDGTSDLFYKILYKFTVKWSWSTVWEPTAKLNGRTTRLIRGGGVYVFRQLASIVMPRRGLNELGRMIFGVKALQDVSLAMRIGENH